MFAIPAALMSDQRLAIPIAIFIIGSGLVGYLAAIRIATPYVYRGYQKRDEALLPERGPNDRYVGVAYSDGAWTVAGDTSWDRGYLLLTSNILAFRGLGTEFRLPLNRILEVQVIPVASVLSWTPPKVYIRWNYYGATRTLSIEPRGALRTRDATDDAFALAEAIDERQRSANQSIRSFAHPQFLTQPNAERERIYPADQIVAMMSAIGAGVPVAALMIWIALSLKVGSGGVLAWPVLFILIGCISGCLLVGPIADRLR